MVLLLVSTLPPLAAFAYCTAMLLRKGDRKKWLRLCVVTAVILVTISTFYLSYLSVEPPLPYATFVANILLMSIIPLMYVMVSNQFALKYLDQYFLWIIGYTILALPYQVCQLLYPLPQLMPEHWGNNMLRLSFNAKDYFTMSPIGLVIFLQTCVVLFRTALLNKLLVRKKFTLTRNARLFFILTLLTTIDLAVTALVPKAVIRTPEAVWITLMCTSFVITMWYLMIPHVPPPEVSFTDESNNPAKLGDNSITLLSTGFRALIDEEKIYLQPTVKVELVARTLGTNRTYLSRIVKKEYGKTFPQLILALRIEEAKRILREEPDMKINEVATRCGFKNSSVFGKAFKEETGFTAQDWRKQTDEPAGQDNSAPEDTSDADIT